MAKNMYVGSLLPALGLALSLGLAITRASAQGIEELRDSGALGLSLTPAAASETPAVGAGAKASPAGAKAASSRPLNVYFVNVGQGDAEYIELPNGQTALIDGGPSKKRLAAFLQQHGVTRIDHVVLTHPHADHFKGLNYVFDSLEVGHFYDTRIDNSGSKGDNTLREKAADKAGCSTSYPRPGESLDWGQGVQVKVFNSCPDPVDSGEGLDGGAEINNCSITLKVSVEGHSVLFPGDAQSQAEAKMVAAFGNELQADVLKVPHHGSSESSSDVFLAKVKPKKAVLEVGKNGYGLPTDSALARLQTAGAVVLRTDVGGTLDGSSLFDTLLAGPSHAIPASTQLLASSPAPVVP